MYNINTIEFTTVSELRNQLLNYAYNESTITASWGFLKMLSPEVYDHYDKYLNNKHVWVIAFIKSPELEAMEYPVMFRAKVLGFDTVSWNGPPSRMIIRPTSGVIQTDSDARGYYKIDYRNQDKAVINSKDTLKLSGSNTLFIPEHAAEVVDIYKEYVTQMGGAIVDSKLRGKRRLALRGRAIKASSLDLHHNHYMRADTEQYMKLPMSQAMTDLYGKDAMESFGYTINNVIKLFRPQVVLGYADIKESVKSIVAMFKFMRREGSKAPLNWSDLGGDLTVAQLYDAVSMWPVFDTAGVTKDSIMQVHFFNGTKSINMKLGKFLTKYVTKDNEAIKSAVTLHKEKHSPPEVKFAITADEICHVYAKGPSSCMSYKMGDYSSSVRPVAPYGDSDLQCAYIEVSGRITARTIVSRKDKGYIRVYGDSLLDNLLRGQGYERLENLDGYALRVIKEGSRYVGPYLDGNHRHGNFIERDGEKWIELGRYGDFLFESTNGYASYDRTYDDSCGYCGSGVMHDETTHITHGDTEIDVCEGCATRSTVVALDAEGQEVIATASGAISERGVIYANGAAIEAAGFVHTNDGWLLKSNCIEDPIHTGTFLDKDSDEGLAVHLPDGVVGRTTEVSDKLMIVPWDLSQFYYAGRDASAKDAEGIFGVPLIPLSEMMKYLAQVTLHVFFNDAGEHAYTGTRMTRRICMWGWLIDTGKLGIEDTHFLALSSMFQEAHLDAFVLTSDGGVQALPPAKEPVWVSSTSGHVTWFEAASITQDTELETAIDVATNA